MLYNDFTNKGLVPGLFHSRGAHRREKEMSINKVMISGRITRDPELRVTAGGMSVLTIGVAVNERKRNANGEFEDYANFVECSVFGKRADALAKYLAKGTKVVIEGHLHYSSWEDKNGGGRRSKLTVYVDELEFMSARSAGNGAADERPAEPVPEPSEVPAAAYNDEDIPF